MSKAFLGLVGSLTIVAAWSAHAAQGQDQGAIKPLPDSRVSAPSKLTCSDFAKSITDGGWSPTHDLQYDGVKLKQGTPVGRRLSNGVDLLGLLQKQCGARQPSG